MQLGSSAPGQMLACNFTAQGRSSLFLHRPKAGGVWRCLAHHPSSCPTWQPASAHTTKERKTILTSPQHLPQTHTHQSSHLFQGRDVEPKTHSERVTLLGQTPSMASLLLLGKPSFLSWILSPIMPDSSLPLPPQLRQSLPPFHTCSHTHTNAHMHTHRHTCTHTTHTFKSRFY